MSAGNKPAFPGGVAIDGEFALGMTLREYYAGKAMAGLITTLSSKDCMGKMGLELKHQGLGPRDVDKAIAKCAADYANALIAELDKGVKK